IGIGNTLYNCLWQPGKPIQVLRTTTYPRILKNFFPGSKGLYITFYQAGVYFFEEGNTPETLLPEAVVNHVFEDKDGNTWMGTDGKGLFMLKRKQVLNRSVEPNTTTERAVILLNDKNGSVFCGYDNMTVTRFQNGQAKQFIVSESGRPEAGFVTAMQFRKHNELMLGTSKGLVLLNLVTGRTRNLKINGNRFSYIKCLYVESDSISYAGTSSHLLRVLIGKGEQLYITDTLMPERTISVHPRNNSQLWAGTLTGLYSVAQHGHGQVEYANGPLRTAKINSMATRNGFSYFATDRGLIISGKTFSRVVNKAQGLSDENCKRINLFGNAIFTATSTGVFRIQLLNDSTAGNITQYNQWDGLASDNVNDLLVYNDTVWAATNKGLNIFVPASIPAAPRPGVALLGLNTGAGNYAVHEPQVLPAGENNVTVSYAGISFYNRNGLYFEYRLLNRFTQWTRTANTSVTFNGLKPGTYTFEIRAFNANGTPGAVTERLQFSIKPFFWQTTAFRILLAAVIIALVFWLLRLREQRIKRKQRLRVEYENKVSELELEAIKAQINPHFIYNCLNAIQNSILKNNMEESHRQLSLFSKLVRKTLDLSRMNFINLAEEMAYLDMYLQLEKMRFREQLQYSIQAEPGIALQETEIPVMLLQPFVENAVKHGLKTNEGAVSEIKVRFSENNGLLECSIEDSGAGMPPGNGNNTHQSLGMHISSGRADTYNKLFGSNISIRHLNKPGNGLTGTGTIVIVQIPLK
ncbi:MAG: histidine kinase, partial [Dinghuibacter sp.]|nr:histidine kinase [Dinghuibacter sp.]